MRNFSQFIQDRFHGLHLGSITCPVTFLQQLLCFLIVFLSLFYKIDNILWQVLFGWGGISHVRGRTARVGFLSAIRDLCRDGAPMLISFLSREPQSRRFHTTRSVATAVRRLRRDPSPVELGDAVDGSFDHYFAFDEMATELAEAGFTEQELVRSPYAHIVATAS